MTRKALIKKIRFTVFPAVIFLLFSAIVGLKASAEEQKLIISVTPSLFNLKLKSGQEWRSSLTMINPNSYDLTIYASTLDLRASAAGGKEKLTPVIETNDSDDSLANLIEIQEAPIFVERGKSVVIPFWVKIPEDFPGGHYYAIILLGNQPLKSGKNLKFIQVGSAVSSVLSVDVGGGGKSQIKKTKLPASVKSPGAVGILILFAVFIVFILRIIRSRIKKSPVDN